MDNTGQTWWLDNSRRSSREIVMLCSKSRETGRDLERSGLIEEIATKEFDVVFQVSRDGTRRQAVGYDQSEAKEEASRMVLPFETCLLRACENSRRNSHEIAKRECDVVFQVSRDGTRPRAIGHDQSEAKGEASRLVLEIATKEFDVVFQVSRDGTRPRAVGSDQSEAKGVSSLREIAEEEFDVLFQVSRDGTRPRAVGPDQSKAKGGLDATVGRASPPLAGPRRHSAEIRWEGGISKQPRCYPGVPGAILISETTSRIRDNSVP
ncbi:hypothetical protein Bbelb_017030 [Branchiostoma belcheri]|nr:hypothetical protein Bbelb_017030 [Branchiostoma belcheri]